MNKVLSTPPFFLLITLFLLGFVLLLPLFNRELLFVTLGIYIFIFCLAILLKPGLALNLLFLFIFAGTLFSVNIGFTLKASHIFAVFAFFSILIQFFNSVPQITGLFSGI